MNLSLRLHSRSRLVGLLVFCAVTTFVSVPLLPSAADRKEIDPLQTQGQTLTPAGSLLLDAKTRRPAVGALPLDFVRSPDHSGIDGLGRYLIAVNSGFGIQFDAHTNRAHQSLAVIDLNAQPPVVIENVYFPAPQSVNVGLCFAPQAESDGTYLLYASGGFENKIWMFRFRPGAESPIAPASPGPATKINAPFIDVSGFAAEATTPRYNNN